MGRPGRAIIATNMPIRTQPIVRYRPEKDPFSEDIRKLLEKAGCTENDDLIADVISTALKLVRDKTTRGELKVLSTAVKELRYAYRVFAAYRDKPKVSVFGSARTPKTDPSYKAAADFSREICERGWMVITGAGGGIMEAGHDGAGREKSFGVAIRLPFEQTTNTVIDKDHKLINFKYFFTRKLMFVKEAKAVCVLPGGFGTMDEAFEVLTLIQTGKASPMPVVLLDAPGGRFWKAWQEYVKDHLLAQRLISPDDVHLYHITDSVTDAVDNIARFYRRYHSSRFVKHELIVRLGSELPSGAVDRLNAEFGDMLVAEHGPIKSVGVQPEEENESDAIKALPRLSVPFNRRQLGRLRQMIDRINEM
jgi:uncharacterized protein (TIGR00730 family)